MVKLDLDTRRTVPAAPPAAGPDRALDPAPPTWCPADAGCAADAGPDVATPTERAPRLNTVATTINPCVLGDSSRRTLERRSCRAMVPVLVESGEGAGFSWGPIG